MTDAAMVTRPENVDGLTVDGYLAFLEDRPKGERWELDDGRPVMNPQPTRRHDWIQANILMALRIHRRLHGTDWRPAGPSQVPVPGCNRTVAPDVLVAPEGGRDDVSITEDPIVGFEILSRSDRRARRDRKLADYEDVPSFRHYVLVRQDRREVTACRRGADGSFVVDPPAETVELTEIGVSLSLNGIFEETPLAR